MKRIVLDTNIIVSSVLGGTLELILDKWDQGAFVLVMTSDILSEYFDVLNRPKFRLKQESLDKITRYIYQFAEFVVPAEPIHFVEADPKDDKFLEAAIAGQADYIVSGDHHLLEIKVFRTIPIVAAREFLELLGK